MCKSINLAFLVDAPEYVRQCVRAYTSDWTVIQRNYAHHTHGNGLDVPQIAPSLKEHEFQVDVDKQLAGDDPKAAEAATSRDSTYSTSTTVC